MEKGVEVNDSQTSLETDMLKLKTDILALEASFASDDIWNFTGDVLYSQKHRSAYYCGK